MEWYEVDKIENIDTPALLLYKTRIQENIDKVISIIKNTSNLRPHVKTNKMREVCEMMMASGIEKFKCATIAEAEMLALINAKDVLLAYQPVGPKAKRFLDLNKNYSATTFSCLTDDVASAKQISAVFNEAGLKARLWIDINTGMNRTGVDPDAACNLLDDLLKLPGIIVVGLHVYDGHITDSDFEIRQKKSDAGFAQISSVQSYFARQTGRSPLIAAGGSPTFRTHIKRDVECSPGTFVFWDFGYTKHFPDEEFQIAAVVITRVVSIVNRTLITTDLGYKSVSSENPLPRVHFLNASSAKPLFQNEEHLVMEVPDSDEYKPGDVLYGVPVHICPTVALYDEAVIIDDNKVTDHWKIIGRSRKINY